MKKTMKKILASVIAVAMILTAAPLSGIAQLDLSGIFAPKASALEASGQLTDTITYTFDESTGKLTISGTGEMPDFAPNYSSGNPVTLISPFEEAGSVRSVSFSEGISKIGSSTFSFCSNLTDVEFADSIKEIGDTAFGACGFESICIPDTVEKVGFSVFVACENLTQAEFAEGFNGEFVLGYNDSEWVNSVFDGCNNLQTVYIPESMEVLGSKMFNHCDSLSDIYYAGSRSEWENIEIGDNADALSNTTIHYGRIDASGALSDTVSYTYDKDTGVLTISGTGAIPTYVSASASPFAGREFSEIIIEEGITEIGSYVFPNCDIGTLSTPITLDNVKDNAFAGSTADNIIVNYYLGEDSAFDVGETGNEMLADPGSFEEYVYEIVTDTITACYNGKTMGLTYSGTGAIPDYSSEEWGTFSGTGEVHSVVFEEGITHIGDYSLVLCNGIESIILPDSLESIGEYAFALDAGLKTVTIGKNLTEIGLAAFTGCYSLEAFNVSADNTAFCSVDGVLYSKDRKELVLYPAGKEDTEFEIPAGTETLCAAAFAECDNLTKVTIPTSVTEIGEAVFNGMDALTDVYYLGTQAEWENITMGDSNTSLRDVTMHYVIGGKITDTTSWTYNEETQTLTITGTGDSKISYNYNGETYDFEIKNVVIDTEAYSGDYEYVFENFSNAESFRFTSKVSDIDVSETGVCFCNFYKLKSFIVDEDNSVYESIDGVLFDSVNNTLLVYPIGKSGSVYTVPDGTVAIGDFAFMASYITEVILPDSLESIGYLAFNLCWNLSSIDLNNVKYVDDQAFLSCYSLSDVDFGNNLESIGGEAFYGTALKNVVIPASVKELWSLSFGSLELESVTFEEGFDFCNNKTQGSGELCNVFDGSTISKLYLPSSITNVYAHLFRYCDEIQDVYFNGTAVEWAEIEIGEGNEAIRNAEMHFAKIGGKLSDTVGWTYDETTKTLTICGTGSLPENYTYSGETYDFEIKTLVYDEGITKLFSVPAFSNKGAAEIINISSTVEYLDFDFSYSFDNLKEINVAEGNKDYCSIDGVLYSADKTVLVAYPVEKEAERFVIPESVTEIDLFAFANCKGITELVFSGNVKDIWMENCRDSGFEKVDLYGVESIGSQGFYNCENLSEVVFYDSLKEIGGEAFGDCPIDDIVIPAGTVFYSSSFEWDGFDNFTLADGYDFVDCMDGGRRNGFSAKNVYIPSSVTNIPEGLFYDCKFDDIWYDGTVEEWKSIDIAIANNGLYFAVIHCSDGDLHQIGSKAYYIFDDNTETLTISGEGECFWEPEEILWGYGLSPFEGSSTIETVVVEEGITLLGYGIFNECCELETVYLPESLEEVIDNAFDGCMWLTDIYYSGTPEQWSEIEIGEGNEALENAEIHFSKLGGKLSETVGWTYDEDTETLTICGTGTYDPYDYEGEKYALEIKHIVYDEGITEYFYLGHIFENIYDVETLHLASTVTSGLDGGIEFDIVTGLEDITVAEGNPAFCSVDGVVFNSDKTAILAYSNHGRTSYTIPESVTEILGSAFIGRDIEEIIFTGNVKEIPDETFWDCSNLVRADLTGVEIIDTMAFMWCENLSEVIFDDNLKYIGYEAFTDCAFTEIVIPAGMEYFTSSSFNTMGFDTFRFEEGFDFDPKTDYSSGCGFFAEEMYIPSTVTNIPESFMNDETYVRTIYYNGTKADWAKIDIGENNEALLNAAVHCTDGDFDLIPLGNGFCYTYEYTDGEEILTIYGEGEMPSDIGNIELPNWINKLQIVISDGITVVDGLSSIADDITILYPPTYYIPETVTEIRDGAFIRTGEPGGHIIYAGTEDQFDGITIENKEDNLTYVSIKCCKTSGTISHGQNYQGAEWTFNKATGVLTISGSGDFWGLEMAGYSDSPFSLDETIRKVVVGEGITALGARLFWECNNLEEVEIRGNTLSYIGPECFQGCNMLNKINIPVSVNYVAGSAFDSVSDHVINEVSYGGFEGQWRLIDFDERNDAILNAYIIRFAQSGNLTDTVTWTFEEETGILTVDGTGEIPSFEDDCSPFVCDDVKMVVIGEGITAIGDNAFNGCSFEYFAMPNTVTYIGSYAFTSCYNLKTIYISNAAEIAPYAFYYTNDIEEIYVDGSIEDWNAMRISEDGNDILRTAPIHFSQQEGVFAPEADVEIQTVEGVYYINGFNPGSTVEDVYAMAEDGWTVNVETADGSDRIGTGSVITMTKDNAVFEYVAVVYGDTTGDSWYDGMDAVTVSCIANNMITVEAAGSAVYEAADCNHDGVIDQLDVDLLQQAGVLLADVDQSKSEEELLETSSAYVEYLNLIDQTVETETTEVIEEEPVDPGYTFNFFDMILNFIKEIITVIKSVIAYFK